MSSFNTVDSSSSVMPQIAEKAVSRVMFVRLFIVEKMTPASMSAAICRSGVGGSGIVWQRYEKFFFLKTIFTIFCVYFIKISYLCLRLTLKTRKWI